MNSFLTRASVSPPLATFVLTSALFLGLAVNSSTLAAEPQSAKLEVGKDGVGPLGIRFLWIDPKDVPSVKKGFWVAAEELSEAQCKAWKGEPKLESRLSKEPGPFMSFARTLNQTEKDLLPEGYRYALPDKAAWSAIDTACTGSHSGVLKQVQSGAGEWVLDEGKPLIAGGSDWAVKNDSPKRKLVDKAKQPLPLADRKSVLRYVIKPARQIEDGRPRAETTPNGGLRFVQPTKTIPAEYADESPLTFACRLVIVP